MRTAIIDNVRTGLLALVLIAAATGCSTTSSTKANVLKTSVDAGVDLSGYQIATVMPFEPAADKEIDASVGIKFADGVLVRLQGDFGPIFGEVRKGPPLNRADELIVTGTIRAYKPGSRFGRAMLIGVGAASFKGDLVLKDAVDGRVLLTAPFDKLWAWGGILGATKGIEDMVAESEAAVATTIAQARGWKSPAEATSSR